MSAEFIDTNILVYAHAKAAGVRHKGAVELIERLALDGCGALSTQVLVEFYSAVTGKLRMKSQDAESVIADLAHWTLHRPGHADIVSSIKLQRRYKLSWWDAMIIHSALETGAKILWTDDMLDGQRFGALVVRNPFV